MAVKRGEGSLFKKKYKDQNGKHTIVARIWWIQYSHRGKVFRESSGSEDERIARRLLRKRLGEIGTGVFRGPQIERTTFEEMAQSIVNDYKINARKSADKVGQTVSHLRNVFGMDRMIEITTDRIKAYVIHRQEDGAANATINRELATLKRMFSLGLQESKVVTKPYIPTLVENNVRSGFFEHDDFIRLRKALPEDLRPLVTFAHYTGWRAREIKTLRWNQVDLKAGAVRLNPGTTKNNQGRLIFLHPDVRESFAALWKNRRLDCPWVFHRGGRPIGDFRGAWESACKKAGLSGMLFHDFRRTAVRNMVRAGVPERVAMRFLGIRLDRSSTDTIS